MLKFIKSTSPLPWMCIGDFNEVLHQSEHVGVQERSHAQIDGFREMVDVCGLYDLGFEGRSWTLDTIDWSLSVTEPPRIVPYYRLSLSTWPLSNNKELLCRFRRVKPSKSHTTGSLICAKPTRRRDKSTTLHYTKVHKFNIITNQVFHT
jgi:hypothetical protein